MIDAEIPVLLDTMVIIELNRTGLWGDVLGHCQLHTVETCVEECATGNQRVDNPVDIDLDDLKKRVHVAEVSKMAMAQFELQYCGDIDLDAGEKELLAYASTLSGAYYLCSSDKACLRVAYEMEILDSVVSLEELAEGTGKHYKPKDNHSKKWLGEFKTKLLLEKMS